VVRGSGWESGEGWQRVKALIELAKQEKDEPWMAQLRERTLRRILAKVGADAERSGGSSDAGASETAFQVAG
jgi:hypothetical protein